MPLRDDLKHSVRALTRAPWFAGALVVSAAIGIGVNALVFGFIGRLVDPSGVFSGTADSSWLRRLHAIDVLMTSESVFVFVIAATSTIGLLLSRGAARVHETAVRATLGAQGRQLYRPLLAEGAVIGFIALGVGLLSTFWTVQALPAMFYAGDVERVPFSVNWWSLLVAAVLGGLVILGGALAPMAWTSSRRPAPTRGTGSGLANTFGRWRSGLTIVQLTLCAVMLLSSGSVIKRVDRALRTDHAERVGALALVRLERLGWAQPVIAALHKSFEGLAIEPMHILPGGLAVVVPYRILRRDGPNVDLGFNIIGGEHIELAGLTLISGRSLDARDTPKSRTVALINETAAPLLRGAPAILGTLLFDPRGRAIEIVGVVREIPFRTFQPLPRPMIYCAYRQTYPRNLSLVIQSKSRLESASVASVITEPVSSQGSHVVAVTSLDAHLKMTSLAPDRLVIGVVQVFAVLAVLLSMIGISGVTSDNVSRRVPEIALRIALGAPKWRIMGAVVLYGAQLAIIGITVALLLCIGLLPFVEPLTDGSRGPAFAVWLAAPALLLLMTIVSAVAPARRAASIDPAVLLRD